MWLLLLQDCSHYSPCCFWQGKFCRLSIWIFILVYFILPLLKQFQGYNENGFSVWTGSGVFPHEDYTHSSRQQHTTGWYQSDEESYQQEHMHGRFIFKVTLTAKTCQIRKFKDLGSLLVYIPKSANTLNVSERGQNGKNLKKVFVRVKKCAVCMILFSTENIPCTDDSPCRVTFHFLWCRSKRFGIPAFKQILTF